MKSFTIYEEYYELITLLSEKEQQELLLAITRYMFEDNIPDLNERQTKIFNNLKRPLDASKKNSKRRTKQEPNENQKETEQKPEEIQKETKQEPNENQNNNQKKTHQDVNVIVNVNNNNNLNNNINLIKYLENIFNRKLNSIEIEEISKWNDNELTRFAIKQSVLNGTYSLKYIMAILDYYKKNNITTVAEAEKDNVRFKNKKSDSLPDWFNHTQKSEELSENEKKEMENLLKEFK